jgi:squalene synthase HpnC
VPSRAVALLDDPARLAALAHAENFPVALRLLPRRHRSALAAVYSAVRLIDDTGDTTDGTPTDRLAALDSVEAELAGIWVGQPPTRPALEPLAATLRARALSKQPFLDLLEANRLDQHANRYSSYDDLLGYCALSANPIGRTVLEVFGVDDADARSLSDDVCTALQILEHCQDVGEDKRLRERVYLPVEDLQAFVVDPDELSDTQTSAQLRSLLAFEVSRALTLLSSGPTLVSRLHGWAKVAVAGYVAGGLATADAIRHADFDVLQVMPRPRKRDVARHAINLLVRST